MSPGGLLSLVGAVLGGVALLATIMALEWAWEVRDRRRFLPPGQLVDIGERHLHIASRGSSPGPTVVMELDAGQLSSLWWPVQLRIANFARVCTYDRAGYAWSEPPREEPSLASRVADLHALLQRAEIPGPYVFVAQGMGGLLARAFAREYPRLVVGLVLIDALPEAVLLRRSFQRWCRRRARWQLLRCLLAMLGIERAWARLHRRGFLPADPAGRAFTVRTRHRRTLRQDLRSLTRAEETLRQPAARGALGERPLIVMSHDAAKDAGGVLEAGWLEGQRQLATLSRNNELQLTPLPAGTILRDAPELIVEAVRRVHTAARQGTRLSTLARSEAASSLAVSRVD